METLQQLVDIILSGVSVWNAFVAKKLESNPLYGANLDGANLDGASLDGANLTRASLDGASLYGASLDGANLDGANLDGANLTRANLTRASLTRASLDGASLDGANLTRASLYGASLDGASLTRASLTRASLDGASLDGANLDGVKMEFFGKLLLQPHEAAGLRQYVIDGKVDGSCYEGACCCFVGSMEKLAKERQVICAIPRESSSSIEVLFQAIGAGDTPETNAVSMLIVKWLDEFVLLIEGIKSPNPPIQ
jgi:hypothetical protein